MSAWHRCPECGEDNDITTIHDTLYICDACDHRFNPSEIYE